MPVIYSNNASTTLSSGINDSTTTVPIASASGFPSIGSGEYYFATIANTNNTKIEVVKVTAGTTSLTVTRAQDGTTAQAFDSGDNFQLRVTAATLEAASKTDVNITGGAIAGAAITNDVIDSQHYADGSIDTAHIGDDQVTADKLANSINTDIATGVTANTTANAALPKTGGAMTGAITTNSTFDGRDVATDGTKLDGIEASATADQTDAEIRAAVEAASDSNVFTDADHSKLNAIEASADVTDATNVAAAGAVMTQYVHPNHSGEVTSTADGATVIADNIVDEANLKISNAGTNGYFLQKQSGNTGGLTWAEVPEGEDYIPNGSVMVFFQANAPTGWTKVTTQNDKTLRVVSGTGGGTGGDWAMSAGETTSSHGGHVHAGAAHAHNHNLSAGNHTLSTNEMPSHTHTYPMSNVGNSGSLHSGNHTTNWPQEFTKTTNATGGGAAHAHSLSGSIVSGGSGNTSSAGSHTHTIQAPQYIDVIICSKDA